jgi:endonuclease/exonuclease/phosphatase family metal-dependent hydrolase
MKIVSWNLLHGGGATLEQVTQLIDRSKPDLLLMQETTARIDNLTEIAGGWYAREPLPGRKHGLAAWSPTPFDAPPRSIELQKGIFVARICQIIALGDITVANVHLSHGQLMNRRQLRRIAEHMPPRAAIVGDCNMVGPHALAGFRDVGPRKPTHAMAGVAPLRLDRCFVRGLIRDDAAVLARIGSDHHPIMMQLRQADFIYR